MKKIKEEEVQSEQPELEQATEEPKEIEKMEEAKEASKPAAEEAEPKKEKKGMPRFVKFLLFELLTIVIALGAHFCLLQFVAPILDLNELIEWIIATCASFVLYLVAGYLFNHLIVWKGKGKATFPKFLLSAFLGLVLLLVLIHLGIFLTKIIVPTNPLHYSLTALSINHVLAHGGKSTPSGLGILGIALIAMILYSFLIRAFFVFKGEKAVKKEEVVEEEPKEEKYLTHASFRQIVQEELDKFYTSKKKYVYHSQAQSIIDEEIDVYDKKHGKKEEEKKEEEK
ncbi:MAG: hypothetical protein IKM80_02840 [Bacilli bacterium]|nr:hypothetical protein [Bacilli bacterium]